MNYRPTVLLDMDHPLADFDAHFFDRCLAEGFEMDIGDPADQVHRYATEHIPDPRQRAAARAMVDAPGWFADLPVTPGAVEGVKALREVADLWVVTKPLDANPTCLNDKAAWIERHFPALSRRLITAPNKAMVLGDILLDDAPTLEWLNDAEWAPVIFATPFNGEGSPWQGLPRWSWSDPIEALLKGTP